MWKEKQLCGSGISLHQQICIRGTIKLQVMHGQEAAALLNPLKKRVLLQSATHLKMRY